ncbi:uncharacterized protein LY79DRAFT_707563 [Colletotrichum navitas]|uniref:Uncharacterized protein n=1 Tax=Colletotrichum navitas TaxID=681940 RepID=A0AAD8PM13_9PEZI|nr:uncharacterized protein LY79DRAFT_707563 [Colletotrichum navitas]KAK1570208.1 hypothetical protein LY79DRAFT_707563 [Colletotrichum navitas]
MANQRSRSVGHVDRVMRARQLRRFHHHLQTVQPARPKLLGRFTDEVLRDIGLLLDGGEWRDVPEGSEESPSERNWDKLASLTSQLTNKMQLGSSLRRRRLLVTEHHQQQEEYEGTVQPSIKDNLSSLRSRRSRVILSRLRQTTRAPHETTTTMISTTRTMLQHVFAAGSEADSSRSAYFTMAQAQSGNATKAQVDEAHSEWAAAAAIHRSATPKTADSPHILDQDEIDQDEAPQKTLCFTVRFGRPWSDAPSSHPSTQSFGRQGISITFQDTYMLEDISHLSITLRDSHHLHFEHDLFDPTASQDHDVFVVESAIDLVRPLDSPPRVLRSWH